MCDLCRIVLKMRKHVARDKIRPKGVGCVSLILLGFCAINAHADESKINLHSVKDNVQRLFTPKSSQDFRKVQLNQLSNFEFDDRQVQGLPIVSPSSQGVVGEARYNPAKSSIYLKLFSLLY